MNTLGLRFLAAPCREMNYKLLLTLLKQAHHSKAGRGIPAPHGQKGFSMAMTVVVILSLIVGTLAVANRNSSGLLSTSLQSRNRESRDVAEAGIVQVINELNRERNRRLLVFGPQSGWNTTDDRFKNPCTTLADVNPAAPNVPVAPSGAAASPPASTAPVLSTNNWVPLGAGGNGQFRLVSIAYLNHQERSAAYPTDEDILSGTRKTLIRVTVESRLGSTGTAQAQVTREFEVVPKCCKLSFGDNTFGANFFGRDNRACYDNEGGGLGIVTSINGGTVKTSGNTFNIIDDQTPTEDVVEVLCRSNVPLPQTPNPLCVQSKLTLGKSISVVPTDFTVDIPQWPVPPATITPEVLTITSSRSYIRANKITNEVEICTPSGAISCTNLSNPGLGTVAANDLARRCFSVNPGTPSVQFYCKFTQIDSTNENLVIDSSNGPINLFFDNPQATPTTSHNYTMVGGNGTFNQVSCSGGQVDSSRCSTNASVPQVDRLNLVADEPGSFDFRGSSAALAMNIFAPFSDVIWRGGGNGNPNFIGRLWVDGFDMKGGISMQVSLSPPAFCASIADPDSICNQNAGQPFIDFVARSVSYSSSF